MTGHPNHTMPTDAYGNMVYHPAAPQSWPLLDRETLLHAQQLHSMPSQPGLVPVQQPPPAIHTPLKQQYRHFQQPSTKPPGLYHYVSAAQPHPNQSHNPHTSLQPVYLPLGSLPGGGSRGYIVSQTIPVTPQSMLVSPSNSVRLGLPPNVQPHNPPNGQPHYPKVQVGYAPHFQPAFSPGMQPTFSSPLHQSFSPALQASYTPNMQQHYPTSVHASFAPPFAPFNPNVTSSLQFSSPLTGSGSLFSSPVGPLQGLLSGSLVYIPITPSDASYGTLPQFSQQVANTSGPTIGAVDDLFLELNATVSGGKEDESLIETTEFLAELNERFGFTEASLVGEDPLDHTPTRPSLSGASKTAQGVNQTQVSGLPPSFMTGTFLEAPYLAEPFLPEPCSVNLAGESPLASASPSVTISQSESMVFSFLEGEAFSATHPSKESFPFGGGDTSTTALKVNEPLQPRAYHHSASAPALGGEVRPVMQARRASSPRVKKQKSRLTWGRPIVSTSVREAETQASPSELRTAKRIQERTRSILSKNALAPEQRHTLTPGFFSGEFYVEGGKYPEISGGARASKKSKSLLKNMKAGLGEFQLKVDK